MTLLEVLIAASIMVAAAVSFLTVISQDLVAVTQNRYDLIAQMIVREQLEAEATLGGYDALAALPPVSTFSHPKFQLLPCASGTQSVTPLSGSVNFKDIGMADYVSPYTTNILLQYTVAVQMADVCDASGNPLPQARIHQWQLATLVEKWGLDKTP